MEPLIRQFIELFDKIRLTPDHDLFESKGIQNLTGTLNYFLQKEEKIIMVLPAFPFKSPNTKNKVLGKLPDRGEEIALNVLNSFCEDVKKFYAPGAQVVIFSDGTVFSDLLGVTEEEVSEYGRELHRMAVEMNLSNISFTNLKDHVKPTTSETIIDALCRLHLPPQYDLDILLQQDEGQNKTLQSFRKFLREDLRSSFETVRPGLGKPSRSWIDKECGRIARGMMTRNQAFSNLVERVFPNAVRLSIHSHTNEGPKFGVDLLGGTEKKRAMTPWHNVIVEEFDGTISAKKREEVNLLNCTIVDHPIYSRPWYFKAIPPVVTDAEKQAWKDLNVEFQQLEPFGVLITTKEGEKPNKISEIPMESIKQLTLRHSIVVIRGIGESTERELIDGAKKLGKILEWPCGEIFTVQEKVNGSGPAQSKHSLPMHFDGIHKVDKSPECSPQIISEVPLFVMFECMSRTDPEDNGGETILTDTRRILEDLTKEQKEKLARVRIEYFYSKNIFFGGKKVQFDVLGRHPITGELNLRMEEEGNHPDFPLKRDPIDCTEEQMNEAIELITPLLYEPKYSYRHRWQKDDYVFTDNFHLLHGRTAFTSGCRHLRRIHILPPTEEGKLFIKWTPELESQGSP